MSPSPLAGEGGARPAQPGGRGRGVPTHDARLRSRELRDRAKSMRAAATPAEHRLWQILRGKRFGGYKFKRQLPIDDYIADFVCLSARLVVEADGGQHADNPRDTRRTAYLEAQGFRVLRFWNNEIFDNEEGVLTHILDTLKSPLPNPSPAEGRGASKAFVLRPVTAEGSPARCGGRERD